MWPREDIRAPGPTASCQVHAITGKGPIGGHSPQALECCGPQEAVVQLYGVPWLSAIVQGRQSQDEGCWPLKPDTKVVSLWSPALHHRCGQLSQDNFRRQVLSQGLQAEWLSRAEQAAAVGKGRPVARVSFLPCLSMFWRLVCLEGPRRANFKDCASRRRPGTQP